MKSKNLNLPLLVLSFAIVGCGSGGGNGTINSLTTTSTYAYVASTDSATIQYCGVLPIIGIFNGCALTESATPTSVAFYKNRLYSTAGNNGNINVCNINSKTGAVTINTSGGEDCISAGNSTTTKVTNPQNIFFNNTFAYLIATNGVYYCPINYSGSLGQCTLSWSGTNPQNIAFSSSNAYITDRNANKVYTCMINSTSGELSSCRDSGATGLNMPVGVALSENYVYITNNATGTVTSCQIGNSGLLSSCQTATTNLGTPAGITINSSIAYIADTPNFAIHKCAVNSRLGTLDFCETLPEAFPDGPTQIVFNSFTN